MTARFHELPIIDDVLAGRFAAPELGGPLATAIRRVVVADSLAGAEQELVASLGLGSRLAVVADERTWTALGQRVAAALPGAEAVVLDHPKADEATADLLQERTRHADALVAVGSGTLNDLCKYVTHRTGRSCAVFATAPSMDGYVTTTVSITRGGLKLSLPAQAPVGVFFDLGVLAAAPLRMVRAGLGDTVCRSTAQVDWLLSHLLLDTRYAETPYRLMATDEPLLYAQAHRLPAGDLGAMLLLTRMLILSGLGVLVTHTSHCGSMGEHSISHFIDTFARPHPGTLHGEQVGIATWSMARLQAAMLDSAEPPRLRPLAMDEARFDRAYGPLASSCLNAVRAKPYDVSAADRLDRRLAERWPSMRERLLAVMLPAAEVERVMRDAGAALEAGELGVEPTFYRRAVGHAHELRDRYGFLDLAAQAGRLQEFAAGEG
ncbi:MAG: iron-containing alcohol dehydrogenase [Geminicoccaceae bacterium]